MTAAKRYFDSDANYFAKENIGASEKMSTRAIHALSQITLHLNSSTGIDN